MYMREELTKESITKMLEKYTPPVSRKATEGDFFSDVSNIKNSEYTDTKNNDRIVDNRLQKEYGERKRIKP